MCLNYKKFSYISVIFKYFDKNNKALEGIIRNFSYKMDELPVKCLQSENISNYKFIYDYFEILDKLKYCFGEKVFNQLIELCQNNKNLSKYESFIKENYDKLKMYANNNEE